MASQSRGSYSYSRHIGEDNGSRVIDFEQPALDVAPLNCVPYTGPLPPFNKATSPPMKVNASSSSMEINSTLPFEGLPAMIFLSSHLTNDEWDSIIASTKSGVAVTGSATLGKVGPAIGAVDIAESEDEYVFRVSLPGVVRDEKVFSCDVQPNGKIMIKGVTSTGEKTVCRNSMIFEMQTLHLCPPGEFSISFQLPGPIERQQLRGAFGSDGIFEGAVKKRLPVRH